MKHVHGHSQQRYWRKWISGCGQPSQRAFLEPRKERRVWGSSSNPNSMWQGLLQMELVGSQDTAHPEVSGPLWADDGAGIFSVQAPGVRQSSWLCVWASEVSHLHSRKGLRMCTGHPFPRICPLGNSTRTRKKKRTTLCLVPSLADEGPRTLCDTHLPLVKTQPVKTNPSTSQHGAPRGPWNWAIFLQHTHGRHLK